MMYLDIDLSIQYQMAVLAAIELGHAKADLIGLL